MSLFECHSRQHRRAPDGAVRSTEPPKVSRRTYEVVGVRGVDCPTRYCESAHRDLVTDQRPPSDRKSLTRFGGTYDGDRVVECRARSRPHVAGTSFQQPSCPRLIRAVDQRIALQVARLGDGSTMLQPRGRAHRDQVVSSILADDASDGSPPVVVVMSHRPPKPTSSGTLLLFTLPRATGRCRIGATMD